MPAYSSLHHRLAHFRNILQSLPIKQINKYTSLSAANPKTTANSSHYCAHINDSTDSRQAVAVRSFISASLGQVETVECVESFSIATFQCSEAFGFYISA